MSTISSSLWPIVAAMFVFTVFGQLTSATRGIRLYDGYKLVRATPASHRQIAALQDLYKSTADYPAADIDFWKFRPQTGQANEIFVGPGGEDRLRHFLKEHQIAHQTLVDDLGIEMREAGEAARLDEPEEMFFSAEEFDLGRYHRYDSIVRYLQLLAQSHPQFMRFGSIGKSFEGRDLAIIKLGYPSSNNASSKPIMLLDAGIHAREWIAPAVALHVVNALVNDAKWNDLLRYIDVHVIPSVNPDGYAYSWGKDRLWRRTRSGPYPTNGACAQMAQQEGQMVGSVGGVFNEEPTMCYGTDPNRNFPFHWAESGTDACPCSEVFPGPQPLSEPEAAHLAAYMSSNRQLIKAYLTLHSYGNLLIHAWNYARKTYPEEVDDIKAQAERMVQAIVQSHGAKFAVGSAPDILYEAAGGSDDFASSLGIKYSYTMELTSGSFEKFHGGFIYPERAINQEAAKVLPGIYELAAKVKEIGGNF